MRSLRLIDGVALAAGALLLLKIIGMMSAPSSEIVQAQVQDLPAFAKVIAHARSNEPKLDVGVTGSAPAEKKTGAKDSKTPPDERPKDVLQKQPVSPSEKALMESLGQRREEIQNRSRDVEMREKLLEDAERKLEARINDLRGLEEQKQSEAAKKGETEAAALKNLVTMYESMKPKDAARVFDRLSLDILVPVVLQMNPRKMSEVLAAMTPESAEKLTVALATRARGFSEPQQAQAPKAMPPNELPAINDPNIRPSR